MPGGYDVPGRRSCRRCTGKGRPSTVLTEAGRGPVLAGHPLLPEAQVLHLSRTTPERERYELGQVGRGRMPFTTRSTVFDTTGYGEVGSRLARFGGKVPKAAQILRQPFPRSRP